MRSYHESDSLSSGGYSDSDVRQNPYAVVPPIGKLLAVLSSALAPGGSFRPGNRDLARRIGASAGAIPPLLAQLVADGWIAYDPESGVITLGGDQNSDHPCDQSSDHPCDQNSDHPIRTLIADGEKKTSDQNSDRVLPHMHAGDQNSDRPKTPESPCKEEVSNNSYLHDSSVTYGGDQNSDRPPPAARLMAELGAHPSIIRDAYKARADWTPAHVRDRWEYDQKRIAASEGRLNTGVFFAALKAGQLAPPPNGLDPEAYRGRDGFLMGGDTPVPTIRDRAQALLAEPWTGANHERMVHDAYFLEACIRDGATDAQALAALKAVQR